MLDNRALRAILDNLTDPIVFVDNDHIIRYVNPVAESNYKSRGFEDLVGKSLMFCHNLESQDKIRRIHAEFESGSDEAFVSVTEGQRIFARAVRGREGELIGYYERYEPCRD